MRVVHIIKIVLTAGAERHLLRLLPGLQAQGVDVRLLVLVQPDKPMDDFMALAAASNIPTERMTIHHHADVTLIPRLARRLHQLKPDIVHTHLIHADLYGIVTARLVGVRAVVMSRHNDNAFRYKTVSRWLNRWLWSLTAGGVAISEALRQFCVDVEGAAPHKVQTIHYGLDLPPNQPQQRQMEIIHIGTVSRLIEQKGLTYAIEAFALLAADYPNVELWITGDGHLRSELEAQVAALHLHERVRFLGWQADAQAIMAQLDIFLMPSLWEGFGLVLLEAMAQVLPVVATDVSAIPEIVRDGETGRIVPPRDPQALAAALRELLNDVALRQQMGQAGYVRLKQHFSEEKMVSATLALYQSLTE